MSSEEIREWVKFVVLMIGGGLALRTYIVGQRQKRLDNSLKLLDIFFENLEDDDLSEWKKIFMMYLLNILNFIHYVYPFSISH